MSVDPKLPPGRPPSVQDPAIAIARHPTTQVRPAGTLGRPTDCGTFLPVTPPTSQVITPPTPAARRPSLETLETSDQAPPAARPTTAWPLALPAQSDLQATIHEPHAKIRDLIMLALIDSPAELDRKTATEMASCADVVRFYIDPDLGKVRPWMHRCRRRLCPLCGKQRSAKAAHEIHDVAQTMQDPRHMILTMQSTDERLGVQLDRLQASLKKLRRTALWNNAVKGGVTVTEVSWNPRSNQWHPHLHILYDGTFIVQKKLAAEWATVTDGSYIVWLRRCDSASAIAEELSKYIAKPANLSSVPPLRLSEFNQATHRRRMLNKFGSCYGMKLDESDPPQPLGENTYHVSINRIMYLARQGALTPQQLLVAIASRYPTLQGFVYHNMPQLDAPDYPTDRTIELRQRVPRDHPARPPPSTSTREDDEELLEARLFVAFTRFREQDAEHLYDQFDRSLDT